MKHNRICRLASKAIPILILLVPLVFAGGFSGAQDPNSSTKKAVPLNELLKLPGKLLAEQRSTQVVGNVRLSGYRVEELRLTRPINVEIRGREISVDRAWRITVSGGPFPVRALPAVIWVDDEVAGNGIENETLTQIAAITFDGELIRDGAVISVSYGEDRDSRIRISPGMQLRKGGENR